MRFTLLLLTLLTVTMLTGGLTPAWAAVGTDSPVPPSFDAQLLQGQEQFRVWFRTEDLQQDETTVGGTLVIAVANDSGAAISGLTLRIADLTASPCGHLPVFMGDLASGQIKEILVPFLTTREDWMNPQLPQEPIWKLEFVDQAGLSVITKVLGQSSGGGL